MRFAVKQIIIKKFTLSKTERLKSRKLIEGLFRDGKSFAVFPFRIYYIYSKNNEPSLQAGYGVSIKRFKKAVDRNRVKRLMREAYRLQKPGLLSFLNERKFSLILFFIYTGKEMAVHDEVFTKMQLIIKRLLIILNEAYPSPA